MKAIKELLILAFEWIKFVLPHFEKDLVFMVVEEHGDISMLEPVGSAKYDKFGEFTKGGVRPDIIMEVEVFTILGNSWITTKPKDMMRCKVVDFDEWISRLGQA